MSWVAAAVVGGSVVGGVISGNAAEDASNAQIGASDRASEVQRQIARDQLDFQRQALDAQGQLIGRQMERDRQIYDEAIARNEPGRQAGLRGLAGYEGEINRGFQYDPNAFATDRIMQDPGAQFRQQQGEGSIRRTLNAGNGIYSGAAAKKLLEYNSGLASQEYGAAYGRAADAEARRKDQYQLRTNQLANLAGLGQTANSASQVAGQAYGQAGQNSTNQMGQNFGDFASGAGNALGNMGNQVAGNIIGAGNARAGSSMYQGNTWANAFNQGASALGGMRAANQNNFFSQPISWQTAF